MSCVCFQCLPVAYVTTFKSLEKRLEGISFHRFPSEKTRPFVLQKWREFAEIPDGERIRDRHLCSAHFRAEDFIAIAPKRRLRCGAVSCLRDSARLATAMESITSVPQISALADPPVPVSEGEEEIVASSTSGKWATSPLPEVTTPSGKWQVHDHQTEPSTPSSQSRLQSGGILICLTLEPNLFVL